MVSIQRIWVEMATALPNAATESASDAPVLSGDLELDMATRSESWWVCLGFVVAVVVLWNNLRSDSSSQRTQGAPPPRAAAILLAERYESPACRRARDRNVSQWMAISPSRHVQQLFRLPIPSSVFSMGGHSHVAYGQ